MLIKTKRSSLFGGIAAAILLPLTCYLVFFKNIDPLVYQDSDDALITYSHVKHLFELGFIGVSPSGERVEGYSNPLDFLLYSIFYFMFGHKYHIYNLLKNYGTLAGMGILMFIAMPGVKVIIRLLLIAFGGILFCTATLFMLWHGSGMEAAWSEVLMLALLVVLVDMVVATRIAMWQALPWFAASITRAESIYYTIPMLIVALIMTEVPADKKLITPSLKLLTFCALLFGGLLLVRYSYFGHLMPNTARAQNISIVSNISRVVNLDRGYMTESFGFMSSMMTVNLVWLCIPALLIVLLFSAEKRIRVASLLILLVGCLVAAHALIFHASRLGPSRYGAHLAPMSVGLLVWAIGYATVGARQTMSGGVNAPLNLITITILCTLMAGLAVLTANSNLEKICCSKDFFASEHQSFKDLATQHKWKRPLLANADLGFNSSDKLFNHFDLAYLGSPVGAMLNDSRWMLAEFFYEFSNPTIIENDPPWDCNRAFVQMDRRYTHNYTRLTPAGFSDCSEGGGVGGLAINKNIETTAQTPHRLFYNKLSTLLDKVTPDTNLILSLIGLEAKSASARQVADQLRDPYQAFYISQTCFEFWPELKKAGLIPEQIVKAMQPAPGLAPALASVWLTSGQNKYWPEAMLNLLSASIMQSRFGKPTTRLSASAADYNNLKSIEQLANPAYKLGEAVGYRVYVNDSTLVLLCDQKPSPDLFKKGFICTFTSADTTQPPPPLLSFEGKYYYTDLSQGGIIVVDIDTSKKNKVMVSQRSYDGAEVVYWKLEGEIAHQ